MGWAAAAAAEAAGGWSEASPAHRSATESSPGWGSPQQPERRTWLALAEPVLEDQHRGQQECGAKVTRAVCARQPLVEHAAEFTGRRSNAGFEQPPGRQRPQRPRRRRPPSTMQFSGGGGHALPHNRLTPSLNGPLPEGSTRDRRDQRESYGWAPHPLSRTGVHAGLWPPSTSSLPAELRILPPAASQP